jgi:hypothetical protein
MRSHEWIDRRSLALHEAVAAKLEANPALIRVARDNLSRWLAAGERPAYAEWRALLESKPLPEVLGILRSTSEQAARLRQSSPFAGVLTSDERNRVLAQYESRQP